MPPTLLNFQQRASGNISMSDALGLADNSVMDDTDKLRRDIQAGLAAAKLSHSALSIELGRSKDYIGDFLRGHKDTLGHKEILAIRKRIDTAVSGTSTDVSIGKLQQHDSSDIHIELAAFRETLFALLRTLNVPPVLARSRIDDLLEDLRSLSSAQRRPVSEASLRIGSGSEEPEGDDPVARSSDR